MGYAEDEVVPMSRLLQPKVEAEIAFVLGRTSPTAPLDHRARCAAAVDYAVAGARDRRQPGRRLGHHASPTPSPTTPPAGSTSSAPSAGPLDEVEPVDGRDDDDASTASRSPTGTGAACLGDPLNAAGLARRARPASSASRCGPGRSSSPARSGPMVAVAPGDVVAADHHGPRHGDRHVLRRRRVSSMSDSDQGRHHRLRQHRHRPDDQGAADLRDPRDGGDGRHRPRLRRPRPRRAGSRCRPPTRASTG